MIITIGRKPFKGSMIQNIIENECGALNVDACRIGYGKSGPDRPHTQVITADKAFWGGVRGDNSPTKPRYDLVGRFPANLFLNHEEGFVLDKQSIARGIHSAGHAKTHDTTRSNGVATSFGGTKTQNTNGGRYGDSGGASRFFKVFKW